MQQKRVPSPPETVRMGDFANMPPQSSLTGSIFSQRSYGATRVNLENTEMTFLSHPVKNGDTLQRIAVKYDVPVERLKQINKLWSNESLFLLKTLKIPLIKQASKWEDDDSEDADSEDEEDEDKTEDIKKSQDRLESSEINKQDNEQKGEDIIENGDEKFDNPSDFFSIIDSRINKCKEDWTKIKNHSQSGVSVPTVSYDSCDANRVFSPTKHYKHFGEKI